MKKYEMVMKSIQLSNSANQQLSQALSIARPHSISSEMKWMVEIEFRPFSPALIVRVLAINAIAIFRFGLIPPRVHTFSVNFKFRFPGRHFQIFDKKGKEKRRNNAKAQRSKFAKVALWNSILFQVQEGKKKLSFFCGKNSITYDHSSVLAFPI